ncbi:hypothetical protein LTS18_003825, partial [Coniosporium uncinatum]
MVKLILLLVPHLTGNVHIQVNPFDSYSTERMVKGAQRIVGIFQHVDTTFDASRVCIKIPSTWEGLQACKELEEMGIKTLATTLFCLEQAVLAGSNGCTYIAPYVNELRVHVDDGYKHESPNFLLCIQAQKYFERHGQRTLVLPASLTSVQECMSLAGARHITIAPHLLYALAKTKCDDRYTEAFPSLFEKEGDAEAPRRMDFATAADFRIAMTRRNDGKEEGKLIQ